MRSYNILVVEDNPGDALLIQEALRECGHPCTLTFADSLQNARLVLQTHTFDLVLSDMGVRNGGSDEFIRSIRIGERSKSVPIVVLSGSFDPRPAYEAGANVFISKTMDMDEFFSKIKSLMHFWAKVAELPPLED